jgi:hypothetical protein
LIARKTTPSSAASANAIEAEAEIWLYISRNDRRLFRARLRRNG